MARSGLSGAPEPVAQSTVSVITPFFNAERFLREAVDSVLAQTWPRWELLLVDDGSADGSTDIAKAYARHHPGQIRYLEHPGHANRGMSASPNAGAARARGSCLAFLDADDIFLPEKLDRQVAFLRTHGPIEAVYGDSLWWCSWTGHAADAPRDVLRQLRLPADATFEPGELTVRLVRRALRTPATCSVLVRRDAFAHIGGFEERFRAMYEDQAFFLKLFLHCRTHMAPGMLDWYRQHPESCCAVAEREGEFRAARHVRLRAAVELERWLQRHPRLVAGAERPRCGRVGRGPACGAGWRRPRNGDIRRAVASSRVRGARTGHQRHPAGVQCRDIPPRGRGQHPLADLHELRARDRGRRLHRWNARAGPVHADPRVRLIANTRNLGLTRSLNHALSVARGEYIARQDADNVSEPQRLEGQAAHLARHASVALVGAWFTVIDERGAEVRRTMLPVDDLDLRWAMFFSCPFVHSAVMWPGYASLPDSPSRTSGRFSCATASIDSR